VTYKKKWYDDYQWLEMMYVKKSYTVTEIATYIGTSAETVRQLLIKYGLKGSKL